MDRFGSRMHNDAAYRLEFSRHRQILPLAEQVPQAQAAWVAPNSTLVGSVFVSKYATIWYGVTIRGELNPVRIGHFTSVGDGCTIKTDHSLAATLAASVNIGKNVTIEADCNIHSCIIDDDCYIGAGSVIQQGARLERGCHILPNSVVKAGSLIPAGQVWGGSPHAVFVRELSEQEQMENYAKSYTNGASDFSQTTLSSVWPGQFDDAPVAPGEQSLKEYAEENYFKVL